MHTQMKYHKGTWICQTCGYVDLVGYPTFCSGCGRDNITSPLTLGNLENISNPDHQNSPEPTEIASMKRSDGEDRNYDILDLNKTLTICRRIHKGFHMVHLKKLLQEYTVSEIIAGKITEGVFYPSYEVGKQHLSCNKNKPLTPCFLWKQRKKHK